MSHGRRLKNLTIFFLILLIISGCSGDPAPQWSTPAETSAQIGLRPASNSRGEFLVASAANGDVSLDIYRPNNGWLGMHKAGINISSVGLAINDSGQAVYVFQDASSNIHALQYSPDTGWASPQIIGVGQTNAFYPSVAMNNSGAIIVLWRVTDSGGVTNLYSARYEPLSGWSQPRMLSDMTSGGVSQVSGVAMNDSGYAMALWVESTNNIDTLKKNVYSPDTGWGSTTT